LSESRLLEELKKAKNELSRRLDNLEERIKQLEKVSDIPSLVEVSWKVAHIEASAQRLLSSARNGVINLPKFEERLRNYFDDLASLLKILDEKGWPISWDLIRKSNSVILHAAKEIGLPFTIVAELAVEKLHGYAANVFGEEVVEEVYGLSELDFWKKLLKKISPN